MQLPESREHGLYPRNTILKRSEGGGSGVPGIGQT